MTHLNLIMESNKSLYKYFHFDIGIPYYFQKAKLLYNSKCSSEIFCENVIPRLLFKINVSNFWWRFLKPINTYCSHYFVRLSSASLLINFFFGYILVIVKHIQTEINRIFFYLLLFDYLYFHCDKERRISNMKMWQRLVEKWSETHFSCLPSFCLFDITFSYF